MFRESRNVPFLSLCEIILTQSTNPHLKLQFEYFVFVILKLDEYIKKIKMENKWKNLKEMINYSDDGIISKVIEKTDEGNVTLFNMGKGTAMSEHTSTKSAYVYVVEGDGIFVLEGKKIQMSPGVMIFMESNAKHSLSAKENTTFILILNKV